MRTTDGASTTRAPVADAAGSAVRFPMSAHDAERLPRVRARARVLDEHRRAAIKELDEKTGTHVPYTSAVAYVPSAGGQTFWKEDPRDPKSQEYYGVHDGFERVFFSEHIKEPSYATQTHAYGQTDHRFRFNEKGHKISYHAYGQTDHRFRFNEEGRIDQVPSQLCANKRREYSSPNKFGMTFAYKGLPAPKQ
jgi:hypothetical protein